MAGESNDVAVADPGAPHAAAVLDTARPMVSS